MDEQEARLILQAYRPGDQDREDPQFAQALQETSRQPHLAQWFAEERAFDQAIATHLAAVPAPFGLKTRILAQSKAPARSWKVRWAIGLAALAAVLFLLAQVFDLGQRALPATAALPDYAHRMVGFVQVPPTLEMESGDLGAIKDWLSKRKATTPAEIPARLAALEPLGCRVLSYHGHDVTLVCFRREGSQLAHLFVVDRDALPTLAPGAAPVFAGSGEWTTASWAEKDRVYTIAVQGDRAAVQRYLPDA